MPPTENDKTYTIKNKRDALDYVAFGVEVITVIVLFVYTSITVGLYCQTKKALRETKNANYIATRAANTAKESADAAVAAVRPWLIPVGIVPLPPNEIKVGNVFEISFKNVGKVSAVAPWLNEEFIFWKKGMELPHFSGCPKTKRFNYGEVIPDQVVPFRPPAINISLTREQIAALESTSQTAGLFIHVCVHYGTVLTNIEGVTEYCTVAYQLSRTETVPCLGNPDILK